ncbi:MAG: hypothetical protein HOC77_08585 [Chloroflexi bacterium]|nr:hypothetical protein [Chloroflexota bacterium]MBT4515128.1 hypothetical protein [Chloroflexota bacterium]MBT5320352.1 hypothetical protein [Chloroflexota bacterium]MBT6680944.1 hypothetical protein [Chloroflexota bacterium]
MTIVSVWRSRPGLTFEIAERPVVAFSWTVVMNHTQESAARYNELV